MNSEPNLATSKKILAIFVCSVIIEHNGAPSIYLSNCLTSLSLVDVFISYIPFPIQTIAYASRPKASCAQRLFCCQALHQAALSQEIFIVSKSQSYSV
jgi:hypothetical protein